MNRRYVRTIAVASGKGGVGKTNFAANLAVAMSNLGKKVMLIDANLGLSNMDMLLGLEPEYTIQDLVTGTMKLQDILVESSHGIKVLSAGSGLHDLTALDEFQRLKILTAFDCYGEAIDLLLIDTASGISGNVAFFCSAVQEIIIVTSPEPTSVSDAYALINVLFTRYHEKGFLILVNSAKNSEEAFNVFRRLSGQAERFLSISLDYLGFLPFDESVPEAVRAQRVFLDLFPERAVSKKMMEIAQKFRDQSDRVKGSLQFFIGNLLSTSTGLSPWCASGTSRKVP